MTVPRINLADIMEPVARRLLGDPNKKEYSSKDELRYGKKGSVSIDLKKGTFYDHEANEGGGVIDLVRRYHEDDPVEWLRSEGLIEDDTVVATFDYRDEKGALLFQVCRTTAKVFFQRRPNGGVDWINNIKGVRRVPYRLPELIAETGTVFIPEGEKHVDALRKLGLRATCNAGGAGKWRDDYNAFLRDQDVVVLSDNDDAGRAHAQTIASGLRGVAGRVRVLPLPNLKPKGDVVDWLAAGGTVDALARLVEATPDWSPPVTERLILSSKEFVAGFVPPDYLVDGLLQRQYVYSMTAPTGGGKTCIAMRMAAHVALGLPLAGREIDQGGVLYFAGENPDDVRARWIKLCEELNQDPDAMNVFWLPGTPPIGSDEIRKRIDAESAKLGPLALVIVDTSAAYFQGDDENNNAQLGEHARMLRSLVNLPGGPTIIVTCHPTKTPNMENLLPRGGGAFIAEMDGNLVCLKEEGSRLVKVDTHGKFRGPEFEPILFKLQPGKSGKLKDTKGRLIWTVTAAPMSDAERAKMDDAGRARQDELLACMKARPGLSLAELAKALGWKNSSGEINKRIVQTTMKTLQSEKLVEMRRERYTLTKAGDKVAPVNWGPNQGEMDLEKI